MAGRQPNILLLMADQLTPGVLPVHGGIARTPHIDALAERGVVFRSAYCNSPLCAPSRAVFMSGALPSRTGGIDNAAEFRSDIPTFAHYLRHAGYRTILSGKMHFCGPDQVHGFEERLTTDIYPADFGWVPDWTDFAARPDWYHNMSSVRDAGPTVRTNQIDFDEEVVFAARRRLFDIAREPNGHRPFCMVVSLTHPHDPFTIPEPYWSRYADVEIPPARVRIAPADLDPHSRRLRHISNMDAEPVTEAQIRAARRAYLGAVSFVDEQFGAVLTTLRDVGLAEDTVVMLLADHGEMLGERGLWYKMSFLESSCRVPLIVSAPSLFAPRQVAAPVSLADVLPTLAALAGDGQEPDYAAPLDGHSLLPHLTGGGIDAGVAGEYLAEGAIAPMLMLRRNRWKFVHCPADPDQLFDLDADPDELTNLADDTAHAGMLAAFRAEIAKRWDVPALHEFVLASQRRRRFVADALRTGRYQSWDFQPFDDASEKYMRNHLKLDDLEARARFPRVAGA